MESSDNTYQDDLDALKCCVIIPTYNNDRTLERVIKGVLKYTHNVLIVNDGSTDTTSDILDRFTNVDVLKIFPNKGKGNALKKGFEHAIKLGYEYAITIDSDGQHNPDEIPQFTEKLKSEPGSLIVGARNMDQDSVPGKSSFGHKFSNFWYRVETGIKLPDTQSGFRLYPIQKLKDITFFTPKFEFEIEVLVRAAWEGITVTSVPVTVIYYEEKERVTHFRPLQDFTRISILNTVLVFLAFLYFRPRMFFMEIKQKGWREILRSNDSNFKLATAIGFGVFMGIVPIWGYQMIVAFSMAHFFRLNKALVIIASNISFGPMVPIIIYVSFKVGAFFIRNPVQIDFINNITLQSTKSGVWQYVIGSMILATVAGLLALIFSNTILFFTRRK